MLELEDKSNIILRQRDLKNLDTELFQSLTSHFRTISVEKRPNEGSVECSVETFEKLGTIAIRLNVFTAGHIFCGKSKPKELSKNFEINREALQT